MITTDEKRYNIAASNLRDLLHEYPAEKHVILECLYRFLYEVDVIDSKWLVKLFDSVDDDNAREWAMTIKVTEGW